MDNDLLMFRPSNMIVEPHMRNAMVTGDLYNICERVREISDDLRVLPLYDDPDYRFGVSCLCEDGSERLIFKVAELDARTLDRLRKIMALPLEDRIRRMDAEAAKREQERKEEQLDDLYERIGGPMLGDLERCGFIQRPVSYPKLGVTSGGKRAR